MDFWYAYEGGISRFPIPGKHCIHITKQQYDQAFNAIMNGLEVTIDGGFAVRIQRPSQYHVWEDGQWVDEAPEPEPEPVDPPKPTPELIASAKLQITEYGIEGVGVDSAIAGGFRLDTGQFLMFFNEPQADVNYIVSCFDGGLIRCFVPIEQMFEDSFILHTMDFNGNPAEPSHISLFVIKVT